MISAFSPYSIRHLTLNNRIVMPPMVAFALGSPDGIPDEDNAQHYAMRARGGVGMIVVEATCVHPDGRLHAGQLGLWCNEQVGGHRLIADAVHEGGCPVLVQLHHSGLNAITEHRITASDYTGIKRGKTIHARGMSVEEIGACVRWFTDAACRAKAAGYDGVELHGAHSYLLSQFLCADINRRGDAYGGVLENRMRIVAEIVRSIRSACGDGFVIGIRMGFNEPDAKTSAAILERLSAVSLDYGSMSTGYNKINTVPAAPADFPFSKTVYGCKQVRPFVRIPLICVGEVRDINTADAIIHADISDLVAIGRGLLADEMLVQKSRLKQTGTVYTCLDCGGDFHHCRWIKDGALCPRQKRER